MTSHDDPLVVRERERRIDVICTEEAGDPVHAELSNRHLQWLLVVVLLCVVGGLMLGGMG